MALIEEFEKQGSFLFRWRSYIPGLIVFLSLFYLNQHTYPYGEYKYHLIYGGFCFLISLFGLFIRCFTIGFVPAMTSGRNTKKQVAEVVNQTGIYSLIRHPLYLGNFFMFLGIVLFLRNLSYTLIFILFYWLYYERIMFTEEQFLRQKFGSKYLQWANRTPALIPNFSEYHSPDMEFSFRNVLKREYPSLFGILIMFWLYDVILILVKSKDLEFSNIPNLLLPHHYYILFASVSFYIVVRGIVKLTNWLTVEGR